jgi:hypothetical protein
VLVPGKEVGIMDVDGERVDAEAIAVQILPGAARVIAPKELTLDFWRLKIDGGGKKAHSSAI